MNAHIISLSSFLSFSLCVGISLSLKPSLLISGRGYWGKWNNSNCIVLTYNILSIFKMIVFAKSLTMTLLVHLHSVLKYWQCALSVCFSPPTHQMGAVLLSCLWPRSFVVVTAGPMRFSQGTPAVTLFFGVGYYGVNLNLQTFGENFKLQIIYLKTIIVLNGSPNQNMALDQFNQFKIQTELWLEKLTIKWHHITWLDVGEVISWYSLFVHKHEKTNSHIFWASMVRTLQLNHEHISNYPIIWGFTHNAHWLQRL